MRPQPIVDLALLASGGARVVLDDIREALAAVEDAMGIGRPIGAAELPDQIRFFRVLTSLRDLLCPRVGQLVKASDTKTGDLVAIVTDCIISAVGNIPIPAATVAKHVVAIGFDRFCADPAAVVTDPATPPQPAGESAAA